MKFSVLICVYAKEKAEYFVDAIESVLHQTYLPTEIVIIEDGILPSKLEKVIKKYEKKDIVKVYRFKENRGLGTAINEGIKRCTYQYIAKVDSDDICLVNRFEKQIQYLKLNPQTDMLGGQMQEFENNLQNKKKKRIVPIENKQIKKYNRYRCAMNNPTIIFKKDIIKEIGWYNENIYNMEDYDMLIRLISKGYILHNLPDVIVYARTEGMYKRRGGKAYLKSIVTTQKLMLKEKLIGRGLCIFNIITKGLVALMPIQCRKYIYENLLRKE